MLLLCVFLLIRFCNNSTVTQIIILEMCQYVNEAGLMLAWFVHSIIYSCSSVPGIFGNQQMNHMELIKQMLLSCLAEQTEVRRHREQITSRIVELVTINCCVLSSGVFLGGEGGVLVPCVEWVRPTAARLLPRAAAGYNQRRHAVHTAAEWRPATQMSHWRGRERTQVPAAPDRGHPWSSH